MEYPIKGACQCGQVTYLLYDKPIKVSACHCTECQKLSTSAFSVTAIIDASKIEFFGPLKSWERIAESGNRNCAVFCSNCGNRIYHFNPDAPNLIKLKLKPVNFPQDDIFKPQCHIWVGEKLSWYEIGEDAVIFDKGAN